MNSEDKIIIAIDRLNRIAKANEAAFEYDMRFSYMPFQWPGCDKIHRQMIFHFMCHHKDTEIPFVEGRSSDINSAVDAALNEIPQSLHKYCWNDA